MTDKRKDEMPEEIWVESISNGSIMRSKEIGEMNGYTKYIRTPTHGGKRLGAGRKRGKFGPTVPIRVPKVLLSRVLAFIAQYTK